MGAETTLRDTLNTADPNRVASALNSVAFGDILSLVIAGLTPTETGATITSHVCTLAAQPAPGGVFQVNGKAGTAGVKKLLLGPVTGDGALTPAPGEVVWDGGLKLKFNVADANTTCDVTYAKADLSQKASILLRALGEQD